MDGSRPGGAGRLPVSRSGCGRALQGDDALYDAEGRLRPEFQVHPALLGEFVTEAERLSLRAGESKRKLVALQAAGEYADPQERE